MLAGSMNLAPGNRPLPKVGATCQPSQHGWDHRQTTPILAAEDARGLLLTYSEQFFPPVNLFPAILIYHQGEYATCPWLGNPRP